MTTAVKASRSVSEIDRDIEVARLAARAVDALRASGAEPPGEFIRMASPLDELTRERADAGERELLAMQREERVRAQQAIEQEGRDLTDALRSWQEYKEDVARCDRELASLRERRDELAALGPVVRFIESDRVAHKRGVAATWTDGGVKVWVASGRPRNVGMPPAAWLTYTDANVSAAPEDYQRAYGAWPPELRWDESERAPVVEYIALHGRVNAAQWACDDAMRRLDELQSRYPALLLVSRETVEA